MSASIFHVDAYVREFDAQVVAVDPAGVVLDRTAFFPGGGGQPCDLGTLRFDGREVAVTVVRRSGSAVVHETAGDAPGLGTTVRGVLDWDRRHALMRTHTALHILCGVVWRDHGAQVTGGNMQPLIGRLDFEFERMSGELVAEIEAKINAEVTSDRLIRVAVLSRADAFAIPDLIRTKVNLLPPSLTEIRTVEIVGLDLQADGGTHVASTAEVGRIRISRYKSKGRINKRIEVTLDPS